MEEDHWFKAKRHGLGWYLATREGWIVTAMFIDIIKEAIENRLNNVKDS